MQFEVRTGINTDCGKKVLIYGQEGVGKTSLASHFPNAVFIDTEGSTSFMQVQRLPKPDSWQMLQDECLFVLESSKFQTLVIDTFDWAERLAIADLCNKHQVNGIEGFGYGKGWEYEAEEIGRFLDMTERLVQAGIHVVLCCHAITRKISLPEEEDFDHWELKLGNKTTNKIAPLLKEWSDMTLFLSFKTHVIATDDKGKKHKATSCTRVMYATKTAWWDAKNRFGLPDQMPLDYEQIANLFVPAQQKSPAQKMVEQAKAAGVTTIADHDIENTHSKTVGVETENANQHTLDGIAPELANLMAANHVTPQELQTVVGQRGYFPADMPVQNYPHDFVQGCLVAAWQQVYGMIEANRPGWEEITTTGDIPF